MRWGTFIVLFIPILIFGETGSKWYTDQIYNAFLLQSIGETRLAFRTFKNAFQGALKEGESSSKLQVVDDLFKWYRTYGGSCDIMTKPCNCGGEYRKKYSAIGIQDPQVPRQDFRYESEWGKNPEQAKHIRMFMFGVAQIISGVFIVSIAQIVPMTFGWGLIGTGVSTMVLSLNAEWSEYEKRIVELKRFEQKALEATK